MGSAERFVEFESRTRHCDLNEEALKVVSRGKYSNSWCGASMLKSCFEHVMYEQMLWEIKPATVLELGTFQGASAAWMGNVCTGMGLKDTKIYTVDVDVAQRRSADVENVVYLQGDLNKEEEALPVTLLKDLPHPWLVIDDAHVNMIPLFNHIHKFTRTGDYIVWEDTHPYAPHSFIGDDFDCPGYVGVGEGKMRALESFIQQHPQEYVVDTKYNDMFGYNVTWNMNGILKRK